MKHLTLILSLIFICGFSHLQLPEEGAIFGAYVEAGSISEEVMPQEVKNFENLIGRELAWIYFANNWTDGKIEFPKENVKRCMELGRVPYIRLMPWSKVTSQSGPDPIFTMDAFLNGDFDEQLINWARDAKELQTPMILEFGPEVNGNWFPWNGQWNGAGETLGYGDEFHPNGPEKYRDVYRRIVTIFKEQGLQNIKWVFHLDTARMPHQWWNRAEYYYPGDDYIDWIGLSVFGAQLPNHNWITFEDKVSNFWPEIRDIVKNKPLIISEFAVIEDKNRPGRKSQWLEDVFNLVKSQKYPIKAISYWNSQGWLPNAAADFRITSSESSLNTFIKNINDDFWVDWIIEGNHE